MNEDAVWPLALRIMHWVTAALVLGALLLGVTMVQVVRDPGERFELTQTHKSIGVAILGLALVRHLIELHGGTVNAYSDGPGRGSEFIVRLPSPRGPEYRAGCSANGCSSALLT